MKKFQQWFNRLTPARQKRALVLFCLLFAALLILSTRYQQTIMHIGNIVQPQLKTDTLKHR